MANTRMRLGSAWVPIGELHTPVEPPPDTTPPPPGTISHGVDLPATSGDAEQVIGAQGSLTSMSGGTFSGTQTIENRNISGSVKVSAGARLIFRNCRITASSGSAAYAVDLTGGGGLWVTFEDCTIVQRTAPNGKHCIAGYGDSILEMRRCVVRGGIDQIHFHGLGTPRIPTGDSLIPMARLLIEECWVGDNERVGSSHSDLHQSAGSTPVTQYLYRRNRWQGFSLPNGADTLTTRADPETSSMASACYINTSSGGQYIAHRDSRFEGGNNVVHFNNQGTPPNEVTNNKWGLRFRFSPLIAPGMSVNTGNVWAETGLAGADGENSKQVVAGEPI